MHRVRGWVSVWARALAMVMFAVVVSVWHPAAASASGIAGTFVSMPPFRVLDTRVGNAVWGPVAPNSTIHVQIAGEGDIPATGVSAVVVNVTETDSKLGGYVTVYPDGTPRPTASNLNYPGLDTRANLVTVKLGSDGKIALYSSNNLPVQLIADVSGYFVGGMPSVPGAFVSLDPKRILDTRIGNGVTGPVKANSTIHLQVAGRGGVPSSGVSAVVVNVTETDAKLGGYVTVYPDGTTRPTASNLNYPAGDTRANLVTVKVGGDGKIALASSNNSTVQLVADVAGYYLSGIPTDAGTFVSLDPARILDTRVGNGATGPVAANSTVHLVVAGRGGVPALGVSAVVANITETDARLGGYVTVYPDGGTSPGASNLNFPAGDSRANLATVELGWNGDIALRSSSNSTTQLVADVAGYYLSQPMSPPVTCTHPISLTFNTSLDPTREDQVGFTLNGGGPVTVSWGGPGFASPAPNGTGALGGTQTYPANPGAVSYQYANPGIYTVTICGGVTHFSSSGQTTLTTVNSFGDLGTTDYSDAFDGAAHLTTVPTTLPSSVTDLSKMFDGASAFNQDISTWDTSHVTDMSFMFELASAFNQPIGSWNTSNVTDMAGMFSIANTFNQPIGGWDTSKVTDMRDMFTGAFNQPIGNWDTSNVTDMSGMFGGGWFNQPIGDWNTAKVTNMAGMFSGAVAFNQPIGGWNTSSVTSMYGMFWGASAFNQPIGAWDTHNVGYMYEMFHDAVSFDQPIGAWNTSQVGTMRDMFMGATSFNQPIGTWDTSGVSDMSWMFSGASSFDQPIGTWDTSNVTDMTRMFSGASSFNQPIGTWNTAKAQVLDQMFMDASAFDQPIGGWNTSHVYEMGGMFQNATAFNQPIGTWNTSSVTWMMSMFSGASGFDQDLGGWNIGKVTSMSDMFHGDTLSSANYGALLTGWAGQTVQHGVPFDAGSSRYPADAVVARNALVNTDGWTITDGGPA